MRCMILKWYRRNYISNVWFYYVFLCDATYNCGSANVIHSYNTFCALMVQQDLSGRPMMSELS